MLTISRKGMFWKVPPRMKVYEALGAIADGRIKLGNTGARVISSSGDKAYTVTFNDQTNTISSNDNGSVWQGYLGYPAIAYLMSSGKLPFDKNLASALRGIAWKTINTQFNNDWDKTEQWIYTYTSVDTHALEEFASRVLQHIQSLAFQKPRNRQRPPR